MAGSEWAALVPRRSHTLAVLVGTATHVTPSKLDPIASVARNIESLAPVLSGEHGCFEPHRVRLRVDPHTRADVLGPLLEPADVDGELDVLLFYFAGHAIRSGSGSEVCLALTGTLDHSRHSAGTSLPLAEVLATMRGVPARFHVAILDCCFAGWALRTPQGERVQLLTATEAGRRADYRIGAEDQPTVFTGALLDVVLRGVPDGPRHLDLVTLHRRIATSLAATGGERPLSRTVGAGADLALFANPAYGGGNTREGLRDRAAFVVDTRAAAFSCGPAGDLLREHRLAQAVRLARDLVADARGALADPDDEDLLYYRQVLGTLLFEARLPAEAHEILVDLVHDLDRVVGPEDRRTIQARAVGGALSRCLGEAGEGPGPTG
ncbi:hypothetical protein AAH978_10885 [Streptomyces sp. ZYX-F-203]